MIPPNLNQIQSIILKPHAREFVKCIFLKFLENNEANLKWIQTLVKDEKITTAYQQNEYAANRKKALKESVLLGFYLSYKGFEALKISEKAPNDIIFRNGMSPYYATSRKNDPKHEDWEPKYQKETHGMILLASDDKEELKDLKQELIGSLNKDADVEMEFDCGERKYDIIDGKKYSVEPFGYVDGLSQPRFFWKNNRNKLLKIGWNFMLDEHYGSYLVFRKLEQNVSDFKKRITALKDELGISQEYAEAQVMGRFKNGTPLELFRTSIKNPDKHPDIEKFNDFSWERLKSKKTMGFQGDLKCPFHAHIRKTNPRDRKVLLERQYADAANHPHGRTRGRIARRSIPYSKDGKEGLLFMCFQRDIWNQFEKIQLDWSNRRSFPNREPYTGIDPLIGQLEEDAENQQQWQKEWNKPGTVPFDFRDFVTFKGGEYFYAPSITFLKSLGS